MLFRVPEPTIAEAKALGGHCGWRFVPFHSAVYTSVRSAGWFAMTSSNEMLRPVSPRAARFRRLDTLKILLQQRSRNVQLVTRRRFTSYQGPQLANGLANRFGFLVSGRND